MSKVLGFHWAVIAAGAMLLGLAAACAAEPEIVEVEKEVVVEKEVPVEVIVEKEVEVIKEVVTEVEKEVVVEKEVIVEVEVSAGPAFAPSGEVVMMVSQTPANLNAWRGFTEVNGPGYRNVVEQLVSRPLATGAITPMLAASWEISSPTTIEFKIREGLQFHDGTPLNAEAAAVAINYNYDPVNAFDLLDITGPRSAEAIDEYTLRVTTPEPDPLGLAKLEFVPITSAKQIQEGKHSEALIGTGPYTFVEWRQGESLSYQASPEWWGIANPAEGGGAISFEKAIYRIVPEAEVRLAAVLAGEIDIAQFMTPEQCKGLANTDGVHCQSEATVETIFLRLDGVSPLMRDVRVRKALMLAIDKELIVETILGGAATLASQIVNPTALGHNPNLAPYPHDLDYARFLFNEAKAAGVPVDQEIHYGAHADVWPFGAELVTAIANMFRDAGFNVKHQLFVGSEMDDLFVTLWDGCGEVACPGEGTTAEELVNRNSIMMHQHGNEILDFAYSYNLYYACGAVAAARCNQTTDNIWKEAIPLSGSARDMKLQELNDALYDDYAFGYIGHVQFMYGVSDNLNWQVDLNHRLNAKEMSPR
jgi:peptide/nickel transport system substrate-binding protein